MSNGSLPTMDEIQTLHHRFAPNDEVFNLVFEHCQIVAEIALWCAGNISEPVDKSLLETTALLHDVGSYVFWDDNGQRTASRLYTQHALIGAKLLSDEGIEAPICDIISTHVLLGLTKQEIIDKPWPLPWRDYQPQTIEGQLLCYADRFHSKRPVFNSFNSFLDKLQGALPLQAEKFEAWSKRFGVPDVEALAQKYNQPIS